MTHSETPRTSAASSFEAGFCDPARRISILAAAILASALGFIDGSVVAIAMPAMRAVLGASLAEAQWISNAYMLPLSALILAGGAMGDRFGLGRVFSAGIAIFIVASLICALAPTPEVLIAGRALKGVGAAAMIPGSLALIYRAFPRAERGRAIGIWAGASALTTALGPVLGGALLTWAGPEAWRWLFAINLPLGLIAIWLVTRAVGEDRGDPGRRVDLVGAALASAGLGLAAWVLTGLQGSAGPDPVICGGMAGALLITFLVWERRVSHPMMPLELFALRSFSAANLATFFLYFGLSAILFFLPMTVIAGWGVSEAEASLAFVPLTVFIAAFSGRAGRLADRVGPGPLIAGGSAVVALAFLGLGATAGWQLFYGAVLPLMCLMGAGMCLVVAPLSAAVMGAVPEAHAGAASGVNNAVSRIAGLVAVAAMGAVAASGYAAGGGLASFGDVSTESGEAFAMSLGFSRVAYVTAALSAFASLVAWTGIARAPQTGS